MIGKSTLKVPGGKLLKAEVNYEGELIRSAKVCGDFFMHPETAINDLEKALCDIPVEDLENNVNRFFQVNSVTLFGVDAGDFVKVVRLALES